MTLNSTQTDRHQLQQIVAGLTEGVILIDDSQTIVWANQAALVMHGVKAMDELGETVDGYRNRFSLQYRNKHKLLKNDYPIERVIAGEAFRDVVVEVTPPGADEPQWVHRVRSLLLTHSSGEPDCLVLILTDVTDRFEAEERFEASFNANPAPAVIVRLADKLFIRVNRGFLALTGFTRKQVIGRNLSEIDLYADAEHRDDALALVEEGHPVPQWEACLQGPDGSRAVIVAGQPIEVDDKPCMLFTFMDLEPRRQAERALHQNREQTKADFEALYTETPVPLHSLDPEGRLVTVSNRWLELLEYDRVDVLGRPITDFMTSESVSLFKDRNWPELVSQGVIQDREYQFVKRSGAIVHVLLSARTGSDHHGAFVHTTAILTDVTDRRHSEERFATAFSLAPVPMALSTMDDFRLLDANQAFSALIGRPANQIIGRTLDELEMWETSQLRQAFQDELAQAESVRNLDTQVRSASSTTSHCLLSAALVRLRGQRSALMVFQDVTDRTRSEAELAAAIEAVMNDTSWFSQSIIERLANLRTTTNNKRPTAALKELTKREQEILAHISQGQPDQEICAVLGLSRSTIRNYTSAIYAKIGVHTRSGAIVWARERGVTGSGKPQKRS
ncbi:MAG: PAS domain S-box protein [Janthinobacterium lividum]